MTEYSSRQFLIDDQPGTVFPLRISRFLAEHAFEDILQHVYERVLRTEDKEHKFSSQIRCYSSKHGFHCRRTMKLDPVAEHFIYDLVYRNRHSFRKDFAPHRRSFGYRFEDGKPVSVSAGYSAFRSAVAEARSRYRFGVKCDVASYFNTVYHHDLVNWFQEQGRTEEDAKAFGQFLREINSGRTVDCLPQGIYPTKIIGAEFLKFIDDSIRLRSGLFLRFMDDICWFDDSEATVQADFFSIQRMLGEKGLSVNSEKTELGAVRLANLPKKVDEIKAGLLQIRRRVVDVSEFEFEIEEEETIKLTGEQTDYLLTLLRDSEITEQDAELVLALLRDHGGEVLSRMGTFLERFPSLTRSFFSFSRFIEDRPRLAEMVDRFLREVAHASEDQLFWLTKIVDHYLLDTARVSEILRILYEHPNATLLTQAKLLEIQDNRYGLSDLRHEHLRAGSSEWRSWAAAVGCTAESAARRNHVLGYFANGSPINRLIADCVCSAPSP